MSLGFSLPKMGLKTTVAVWVLLLSLTVAIFLYPVRLRFECVPVQSLCIFENLPLFGTLYFVWFASLLWLLWSLGEGKRDGWLRIALVGVFALVYLGFWAVITPQGYITDYEGGALAYVRIFKEEGILSSALANFSYFQFPMTSILGAGISAITRLDILSTRMLVLLVDSAVLGVALYIFLKNMLKNRTLASVGALLAIQGSLMLSKSLRFYPAGLGIILFAVFLMLLVGKRKVIFETARDKIIAVVLMVAIVTTHYITSFYIIAILAGIFAVQLLGREKLVKPLFIIPLLVAVVVWGVFVAFPVFDYIVGTSSDVVSTVVSPSDTTDVSAVALPELSLWWVDSMADAYLGTQVPLWVRAVLVFWVLLTFVFGGVLALVNLFRLRKLDTAGKTLTGAMLGVVVLSVVAVFTSLKLGGYEFFRLFQFGSIFAVPLALVFVWSLVRWRKGILAFLVTATLLLAFPTFLAHNSTIEVDAVYQEEISAGEFLESEYGSGDGLGVFTDEASRSLLVYYLPDAIFYTNTSLVYTKGGDYFQGAKWLEAIYGEYEGEKVFVLSSRLSWSYYHVFGMETDDPRWAEFENRVSQGEKIYGDGFVQIFKPSE